MKRGRSTSCAPSWRRWPRGACAEQPSPALARSLAAALAAIRHAYRRRSPADVLTATTEFYQKLFEGGGKSIAWKITASLNVRINHLRALTISQPGRDKTGPQRMQAIVDAIAKHDGPGAAQACLAHLADAADIAAAMLAVQQQDPPLEARRRTRGTASG